MIISKEIKADRKSEVHFRDRADGSGSLEVTTRVARARARLIRCINLS